MQKPVSKAASLKLVGGRLCLDFLNTGEWYASAGPLDYLTSYNELVKWAGHAGALSSGEVHQLEQQSQSHPQDAEKVYKMAIKLRSALLRMFHALQRQEEPAGADLEIFNAALSKTMKRLTLSPDQGRFNWGWQDAGLPLDKVLWPIVKDAAELFTSDQLPRVSRCADDTCGWFFLDTSRNRSRRWCDMKDCGNRAKVKRHYQKSKITHLQAQSPPA
ncbi:MAG: ABATE domain-containing protein [Candidatus Aminicenantes bacterium]